MSRRRKSRSNSKSKFFDKYLTTSFILIYVVFSIGIAILYNLYKDENIPFKPLIVKSFVYGIVLAVCMIIGLKIIQYSVKTKRPKKRQI